MRTLGYVEQPGQSLKIVLEASDGSVLRMQTGGRLDCEFGVRSRHNRARGHGHGHGHGHGPDMSRSH